jgi:RNA-splicing ligase RtcB
MFERGSSEEDRANALREKLAKLNEHREEIEFYMQHREGDSYLAAEKDAQRLAEIKKQIEETMGALGEAPAVGKADVAEDKKAA